MKRYYYLPFLIAGLVFVILLCSCTTTKNVQKSKTDEKTEIKTVETNTTTTTIDTTVVVKGGSLSDVEPISELLKGNEIVTKKGDLEIRQKYNKITKKLETTAIEEPRVIPVHAKQTAVASRTTDTKKEVKAQTSSKVRETHTGPKWFWWVLIVAALVLGWWVKKRWF